MGISMGLLAAAVLRPGASCPLLRDPGDALGAAISGLCVLVAVATLGWLWNHRLPDDRVRQDRRVALVALALAALAAVLSYLANVTWS